MKKRKYRKLDNTAKVFSLDSQKNANTFRLSVILKDKINSKILKKAINKTLDIYPSYKVKLKKGFFWNCFETNKKKPIIEKVNDCGYKVMDFNRTNEYLFKVTYFNNRIYLDVCHVLTDGLGGVILLKSILYNYLNYKYNLRTNSNEILNDIGFDNDKYLEKVNKKLIYKKKSKKAFLIKYSSISLESKTNHYILDLNKFKAICKQYNVSMSEYLTALYIYSIYKTLYDKKSSKDIVVTIPIDLRKYYDVESFSNFFTYMNVEGNVVNSSNISFEKILNQVHKEFKNKLSLDDIPRYLSRDVRLGTNVGINLVPLAIKKLFMKYFGKVVSKSTTTTFSNLGLIDIEEQYKKYIDNIVAFANAGKIQKVKCTVCSYDNNLVVTINSKLPDNNLEKEFYNLLKKHIGNFKLESNVS